MTNSDANSTLTSLRDSLLADREEINRKLDAIDVLLGNGPRSLPPSQAVKPQDGDLSSGFRGKLRSMFPQAGHANAVKAGVIVKRLKAEGYTLPGKTPLGNRVYNELKRLYQLGELGRTVDGAYFLKS
jgi:hypothetical protein